jgi:multiple sugar transport system permease protein
MNTLLSKNKLRLSSFVIWSILAFFIVIYGLPLLWLFIAGTRSESSLISDPPLALGTFAVMKETFVNLAGYNNFQMLTWAMNSVIYTVGSVTLTLVSCIPAGYALAMSEFKGRKLILIMTLVAMITPSQAIILPIFLEMSLLGLTNTYTGLILASSFFPFGVYLSSIYYTTSLPKSVVESARIDGCGHFQCFVHMALPLAKPLLGLVAFFSFVNNWNNYFLAFVLISDDDKQNLPVGLTTLINSSGALNPQAAANNLPIGQPEAIQAAILVVLPIILVFLISQKYVRSGLNAGAEKG